MIECNDKLAELLHLRGFDVLAMPGAKFAPLTMLRVRGRRQHELGGLTRILPSRLGSPKVVVGRELPELQGCRTSPLNPRLGLGLLGTLLKPADRGSDAQSLFDGVVALVFEIRDVSLDAVDAESLRSYLSSIPVELSRDALPDGARTLLVSDVIRAQRCKIVFTWRPSARSPGRWRSAIKHAFQNTPGMSVDVERRGVLVLSSDHPRTLAVRCLQLELGEHGLGARPSPLLAPTGLLEVEASVRLGGAGDFDRRDAWRGHRQKSTPTGVGAERPLESDRTAVLPGRQELDVDEHDQRDHGVEINTEIGKEIDGPGKTPTAARAPVRIAGHDPRRFGVGFSHIGRPSKSLSDTQALSPATSYWLWCEIAKAPLEAIGGGVPISPAIPASADLDVVIFSNPGGFELEQVKGTLRLVGADATVTQRAGEPDVEPALRERRLFFRLRTPKKEGRSQLRVHIYHLGLLVQALDVSVSISHSGASVQRMECTDDYRLSRALSAEHVATLGSHALSVFVNDSPGKTHGFRFFSGDGSVATSAVLDSGKVQSLIDKARDAMRTVSWGSRQAYNASADYDRYDPAAVAPDFRADLVRLAKCGFQIWDAIVNAFAGGAEQADKLRATMRRPGTVQLGLKDSSSLLLPLALLYDHDLDTQITDIDLYVLCPAYVANPTTCLDGDCPNRQKPRVVCPSGFWGFRHSIGVPVGTKLAPDATATVRTGRLRLLVSAYAGPFMLRDAHLSELTELVQPGLLEQKLTRKETLISLADGDFQVLYFYCHGGRDESGSPFLLVGPDNEQPNRIGSDTLRLAHVRWESPQALVVINGCHTTALEPREAIDLVNGFVETARASGVIGTEITIFEPLAVAMGEKLITYLMEGKEVGAALRDARRTLLLGPRPNPLGLAYVAFALATLTLENIESPTVQL